MAVTVRETWNSRQLTVDQKSPRVTLNYFATGSDDEGDIYAAVIALAPSTYDGLIRHDIAINPLAGPNWDCTCTYIIPEGNENPGVGGDGVGGNPDPNETQPESPTDGEKLDPGISVSIGGSTVRTLQSLQTLVKRGVGAAAVPDYHGAIGVTADGKVEGVDILSPNGEFTVTRVRPFITMGYLKLLWSLVGRTNDQPWWSFGECEVLFQGADITARQIDATTGGGWSCTYKFGVSFTNDDQIVIGNIADNPILLNAGEKKGWEYLWARYKDTIDANNILIQKPTAAYVEQVYPKGDFRKLLIGV
jgi:hypothetical protein